jgi:hypothetical protein
MNLLLCGLLAGAASTAYGAEAPGGGGEVANGTLRAGQVEAEPARMRFYLPEARERFRGGVKVPRESRRVSDV